GVAAGGACGPAFPLTLRIRPWLLCLPEAERTRSRESFDRLRTNGCGEAEADAERGTRLSAAPRPISGLVVVPFVLSLSKDSAFWPLLLSWGGQGWETAQAGFVCSAAAERTRSGESFDSSGRTGRETDAE